MQIIAEPVVKKMGKVTAEMTIVNNEDDVLERRGFIEDKEVRQIHLQDVLMDTGATTLCLPKRYIEQLGLISTRRVAVATASGISERGIYQNVKVQLGGRETVVECVELPNDADPLLGVIPMEAMGIELDLQKQQIKFLPYDTLNTYITAY